MAAIELARRRYQVGNRVALICHNQLLGEWLKQLLKDEMNNPSENGGTLTVGRFWADFAFKAIAADRHLLRSFQDDMGDAEDEIIRFQQIYPRYARMAFRDGGQYDYLVVDEFQDLCREPYLEVLDVALENGLAGGQWAFFGDFARQALHLAFEPNTEGDNLGLEANLEPYIGVAGNDHSLVNRSLVTNCRNTPPIAEAFSRMAGIDMPAVGDWSRTDVVEPRYRSWQSEDDLMEVLAEEVAGVEARGWSYDRVVVLSGRRMEYRGLDTERFYGPWQLQDRSSHRRFHSEEAIPCLRYCTVDSFKGLESDVVILIVDNLSPDEESRRALRGKSVAYVGGSRAKRELITLARRSVSDRLSLHDSGPP